MSAPLVAWYERHRRLVLGAACGAAASYAVYRICSSERAIRTQAQLNKLAQSFSDYSSALSSIGDCASLVTADLHNFLNSDTDEIPRSLGQLGKLLQSVELQGAVQAAAASVTRGVQQGITSSTTSEPADGSSRPPSQPMLDKVLDAILSERGSSLIGAAVGIATKNATTTFCEYLQGTGAFTPAASTRASVDGNSSSRQPPSFGPRELFALFSSEPGERLLSLLITKSMRTAVSTYCEAYAGYNVYDDMLGAISQPVHQEAVAAIMARMTSAFCREATNALRKARSPQPANAPSPSASTSSLHHSSPLEDGSTSATGSTHTSPTSSVPGLSHSSSTDMVMRLQGGLSTIPQQQHKHNNAPRTAPASIASTITSNSAMVSTVIHQFADLLGRREVHSLVIDVVKATTSAATRELVSAVMPPSGTPGSGGQMQAMGPALGMMQKLHTLMCVIVSLMIYSVAT